MAKWHGNIGFIQEVETPANSGIWKEQITEREYSGDVLRKSQRFHSSDKVNDDINISNEISVLSDPFANQNFQWMRYINFMGANWKITNIEIQYPRLILTIGGLYNGKSTNS